MQSEIISHAKGGGVTFAGPDAVELVRATVLRSALGLLEKGIQPTRGFTMKKGLAMVTPYTGVTYKRSEVEKAKADLTVWIETMRSALPVVRR